MFALVAALSAAACGSSPAAPQTQAPLALTAGRYTLNIYESARITTGANGFTTSILLCVGSGAGAIAVPVDVARAGDRWTVHPVAGGTLAMTLAGVPGGLAGSLEGTATAGGVTVSIGPGPSTPRAASVAARLAGMSSIGGDIEGDVSFAGAGWFRACSTNAWSIVPVP